MAILTRDEYMNRIKERIGEDDSPEALSFIADMSDTFDGNADGARISELEQALESERNALADLRKEYKERFFSGGTEGNTRKPDKKGSEEIQINDLFKEE